MAVVVTDEVEEAVDRVTEEFVGPAGAEAASLAEGHIGAEEQFAMELEVIAGIAVIEGDDIGGALVLEEGRVEADDFGLWDEVESEGVALDEEVMSQQVAHGAEERGPVHRAGALPIAEDHLGLRRGSAEVGRFIGAVPGRRGGVGWCGVLRRHG